MTPRLLLLAVILVTAVACTPSTAPADSAAPAAKRAPQVASGTSAPAAAGSKDRPRLKTRLIDGSAYDLAQHRGKWVVVNFWATWCGPCLKEMPELSALADKRDDVEVIGLAYEDIEPADMQAFLAKVKPRYPIALVDTYDPPADFDTPRGLPMTVLIAPDGRVAKKVVGPVTVADLEQAIAAGSGA